MIRTSLLLLVLSASVAWAAPPAALPADGGLNYYRHRAADFAHRNDGLAPPDYYLGYGDVYVRRFTRETRPLLSPAGKSWMDQARLRLQVAMEDRRTQDPEAFARLERDTDAFRAFAFENHPSAYAEGLGELPLRDLLLVGTTPDIQDTLGADGLAQVLRVLHKLSGDCRAQGLRGCWVDRLLTEKRELRRLLRDRWGVRPTGRLARFLGRRIRDSVVRAFRRQSVPSDRGIVAVVPGR